MSTCLSVNHIPGKQGMSLFPCSIDVLEFQELSEIIGNFCWSDKFLRTSQWGPGPFVFCSMSAVICLAPKGMNQWSLLSWNWFELIWERLDCHQALSLNGNSQFLEQPLAFVRRERTHHDETQAADSSLDKCLGWSWSLTQKLETFIKATYSIIFLLSSLRILYLYFHVQKQIYRNNHYWSHHNEYCISISMWPKFKNKYIGKHHYYFSKHLKKNEI